MGLTLLNQLGEWNPQLFRELKGHLKPRQAGAIVLSSLVSQFLLLFVCSQNNCVNYAGNGDALQAECDIRWGAMFAILNWLLPFMLIFAGTYLLISNLAKEEHRGTLNFIRLTPQSSQSILMGKMLGVPALLYLGIGLAVPLHAVSALATGIPLHWLLAIYTLWGAGCYLFYSAAFLMTLLNPSQVGVQSQAWAGSLLASMLGLAYVSLIAVSLNLYRSGLGLGNLKWLLLPLGHQPGLAYVWMLITVSVATYWIWQAANRLFRNPRATLLSKQQSYWLVGSFQVWLLGFVLPEFNSVVSQAQVFLGGGFLFAVTPVGFLFLTLALSPHRQALQDWARYRRDRPSPLMRDLIWGEKSPALVAIAINLLITAAIWLPWILLMPQEFWQEDNPPPQLALWGLPLTINLILIYAAIAEVMLFVKKSKQALWTSAAVGAAIISVLGMQGATGIELLNMPFFWLFSPLPILALTSASTLEIFLGLLAQWSVLGLLTWQLTRQLKKAGESTSKALFTSQK